MIIMTQLYGASMDGVLDLTNADYKVSSDKRLDVTAGDRKMTNEELQLQLPFAQEFDELSEPQFIQDECREREDENVGAKATNRIVGPFRHVDPHQVNTSWQLIEQLTQTLPLNEYKLPIYIYRPDMLDHQAISHVLNRVHSTSPTFPPAQSAAEGIQELNEWIDAAAIPLAYDEGFPTLPNGLPFWNRLDFESEHIYQMFMAYVELGGARHISQLLSYDLDEVKEYYHLYYWGFRVKAFDLYRVAHHQKIKLQRMLLAEDSHFSMADKLLKKVQTYFDNLTLDDENVSPEKAVNMMEKLVKIQRVSVGLPANGESKEADGSKRTVAPVNVIMQQISQGAGGDTQKRDDDIDVLMDNPDAVDLAQELIIKMQQGES